MRRERSDILFQEGGPADEIYLLGSGIVAVTHECSNGHKQIYSFVTGTRFIIPPVDENNMVRHSAECLTDSEMYAISRQTLDRIVEAQPKLARAVHEELGKVIDEVHDHLANVLCRHGPARVAYILSKLHSALKLPALIRGSATEPRSCIGVTQIDLAAAIGMTPVYLNQILKRLKDSGLIGLESGKVKVLQVSELAKLYDS